jgi:hypothetical protein
MNSDGSVSWYAQWMGGPTLAKINKCLCADGNRRTVYITGEADSYFSIPAATRVNGKYVAGYLSSDDSEEKNLVFHATDKRRHISRDYSIMLHLLREDAELKRLFPQSFQHYQCNRMRALAFSGFDYGDNPSY